MSLRHHPDVASDIAAAARWYGDIDEALKRQFLDELRSAFDRIEAFPERFHIDASGWRRLNLPRFPYHILFTLDGSMTWVMTVRHHHQHPGYGTGRK
jgi:toxin ParE1/3/4